MPYSVTNLTQVTSPALTSEMKSQLDAALTGSGKYTKVTSAFVNGTYTYDVWRNDGTTDGYEWYLVVATSTSYPSRLMLGGALEYDDATKTARKALRGTATAGFVDAAGYPLVAAGGAEMTFPLSSFLLAGVGPSQAIVGASSTGNIDVAATGDQLRVLVTGQVVWVWWGTTTPKYCAGVGTYQNLHSTTDDLKPLAFLAHSNNYLLPTVWQHPSATDANYSRSSSSNVLITGVPYCDNMAWTHPIGFLGGGGQDINFGTTIIGSRMHVTRYASTTAIVDQGGNSAPLTTAGHFLGLAPADFLIFARNGTVGVGDSINVNGKTYIQVSPKNAGTATCGLFVNTQPDV